MSTQSCLSSLRCDFLAPSALCCLFAFSSCVLCCRQLKLFGCNKNREKHNPFLGKRRQIPSPSAAITLLAKGRFPLRVKSSALTHHRRGLVQDVEETRIPGAYQEVCKYRGGKKQGRGRKDVNIPIKLLKTRVHSNSRDNTK